MSFLSPQFFFLVAATAVFFRSAPARNRFKVLLVASYAFYAFWSVPFILVLLGTTSVDYFCSKIIKSSSDSRRRRFALFAGISINLVTLMVFKYFNFFIDCSNFVLQQVGLPAARHLEILLPIGISFYTFEAISYLVDVYRGAQPAPNWLSYNFYIMWFPHLIAGPIVRFSRFLPQYANGIELPSRGHLTRAARLIVLGYFSKTIVAGFASLPVNLFWMNVHAATVLQTYVAVLCFAVEIYADFYGYTSIARGVSLMFNIELPLNFRMPVLSSNLPDFWRRWNITLSLWLHDYLFLPLGGSKRALGRTMVNIIITFLLAGLWHGARLNFAIMGLYFGIMVAVYHGYRRARSAIFGQSERAVITSPAYGAMARVLTLGSICIGGVFFRAERTSDAFYLLGRIFQVGDAARELQTSVLSGELTVLLWFVFCLIAFNLERTGRLIYGKMQVQLPIWAKAQAATAVLFLCWICSADLPQQFWYAQF